MKLEATRVVIGLEIGELEANLDYS